MANKWIQHVQSYASKNGINYRDALKDPKCSASYKKGPMSMKSSKKMRGGLKDPCEHLQGEAYADCARGSGNYEGGKKMRGGLKDPCEHLQGEAYADCARGSGNYEGGKKSKRRRCGKKRKGTRKR